MKLIDVHACDSTQTSVCFKVLRKNREIRKCAGVEHKLRSGKMAK
ncbi:hypothetical protein V6Z12_A06G161000 [Gossypium hirsutum]